MTVGTITQHQQLIKRYINQPERLPDEIMHSIRSGIKDFQLQLYAIVDLNQSFKLVTNWLVLGHNHLVIVKEGQHPNDRSFQFIERKNIKEVKSHQASSCTRLTIIGQQNELPLAVVRYTHRQKRTMENIRFLIEQKVAHPAGPEIKADRVYAESLTKAIRETQSSISVNKMTVVWRLLQYLSPYKSKVIKGSIGAILMTSMTLAPAYLTGIMIDRVIRPYQDGTINLAVATRVGWMILLAISVIYMLGELFTWIRLKTMSQIGEYVAHDLRREVYAHLQKLSLSYFSAHKTGNLISRVSSDTDRLWDFVAFGIVEVSISIMMLLGLAVVLISLDCRLGLIITLPVPLFLFLIAYHGHKMQSLFLKAWVKWSRLTEVLSDTIPGVQVVKAFSQEAYEKKRFNSCNQDALEAFNSIHTIWTSFWPLLMLLIKSVMLTVWVFAFHRLVGINNGGVVTLSAGTFVAFILYMTQFTQPIEVIGQLARMLNRATSSAYRIFEVLDTEPQIVNEAGATRTTQITGEVRFENVTFSYDGIRRIIKSISFEIKAGEMIGLVGPSGGGKSTLTNLIARFYDVTSGSIKIDGIDVRQFDQQHLRKQIGIVLQEPYLFHGTVLENIRYGMPDAGLEKVIAAAKAANVHEFIGKLPEGYDTVIGERGHTLSGGERQRVSIARAILHDPKILILDEATSSVDTESERMIQEALERLTKGRTVLAIAHRLSTLSKADRLVVIEDGKIAEIGTHRELLNKQQGIYRKLYTLQQEMNKEFAV